MDGFRFRAVTESTEANPNFGSVFTHALQVNFKTRPVGHFTLDVAGEGIMSFGFGGQLQLFH